MNVLIFGAGRASENFIAQYITYDFSFKILGILDNDPLKWGKLIAGFKVFNPAEVLIDSSGETKKDIIIIITSIYHKEIKNQLINEFGLSNENIIVSPKSLITSSKVYRPFNNKKTYKIANKILYDLISEFNLHNINYFVDHGTLLGLVRNGCILSWDDDIDFSVLSTDFNTVESCVKNYFLKKSCYLNINYSIEKFNDSKIRVSIFQEDGLTRRYFPIDISSIYFDELYAYQSVTYSPKIFFQKHDILDINGLKIKVPYNYKEYLTFHYKDWEIEKKDISWESMTNIFSL